MQALGAQGFAARAARHGDFARGAQVPPAAAFRLARKVRARLRASHAPRGHADPCDAPPTT